MCATAGLPKFIKGKDTIARLGYGSVSIGLQPQQTPHCRPIAESVPKLVPL